jgi:hypothetical protein
VDWHILAFEAKTLGIMKNAFLGQADASAAGGGDMGRSGR